MKNLYLVWLAWPEKCFRADAEALRLLESLIPAGSDVESVSTESEFLARLPEATHAIVWNFRSEWFARAGRLRLLATPAAGRELVPTKGPDGVKIHFGGFHGAIIAESVAAFVLAWARGFFRPEVRVPVDDWGRRWPRVAMGDKCRRVAGTRAVIAGYGRIGKAIGAKLEALGVSVKGFGRSSAAELPSAAREADWFVMALPGDTGTDGFLGESLIAELPRRAVAVNVGRGNAVDEAALLKALEDGRIAGAYLDVFRGEPGPLGGEPGPILSRTSGLPWNLVTTPHSSAFSGDYLEMCFRELGDEGLL